MTIDWTVLTQEAYADDSRLSARISIYAWQRPPLDLVGLALDQLGAVSGPVLDIGWGTGSYTRRLRAERPDLRVVPVDLSAGMAPEVVGEVDRLPFADGCAGGALAMHMLYHATDPLAALGELRRVLRPGGRLVVSTNASDDKRELEWLWRDGLHDLGVADPPPYPSTDDRFSLELAHRLVGEAFGTYDVVDHRYELVVPEPEPVVSYVDSTRDGVRNLPAGVTWPAYLAAVERRVRTRIEAEGAFRVSGHVGVLTASA